MSTDDADNPLKVLREAFINAEPEREDGIEVKTYDDVHYYVVLTIKGGTSALQPDDARDLAEGLLEAAAEADRLRG